MGDRDISVLDLFAGMGGLSFGFSRAGFSVTGVDIVKWTQDIFTRNSVGNAIIRDLRSPGIVPMQVPVLIGGPPCRPWSCLNLRRDRSTHPDRVLLEVFFEHVMELQPEFFLMENVPSLKSDQQYRDYRASLQKEGYQIDAQVLCYSHFGAPVSRHRLFTVGCRRTQLGAVEFFLQLNTFKNNPQSVGEAIGWLRGAEYGEYPDHIWPQLKTIDRYERYYKTGKYGWYRLEYDRPSPSFGNPMKTYILHPEAGQGDFPKRVISVREALCIMGFERSFVLPEQMPMSQKYQMVADTVSPIVSELIARVIRQMLQAGA